MGESKKYWYIQLNVNFFDDERIDWLCDQKNGYAYIVLYLKLCLKTANNNGILTRRVGEMIIPYNVDKIADITHMDVDVVRVALELYKKIGLICEANETCTFMRLPEVPGMVGYTTQYAIDKARQRKRKKEIALSGCQDDKQDIVLDNEQDVVPQELRNKSIELRVNNIESNNTKMNSHAHFVKPTVDEVRAYCQERRNCVDPERFVDYYEANGWKVGKNPMKDWKATVRNWEKNGYSNTRPKDSGFASGSSLDFEAMEAYIHGSSR